MDQGNKKLWAHIDHLKTRKFLFLEQINIIGNSGFSLFYDGDGFLQKNPLNDGNLQKAINL